MVPGRHCPPANPWKYSDDKAVLEILTGALHSAAKSTFGFARGRITHSNKNIPRRSDCICFYIVNIRCTGHGIAIGRNQPAIPHDEPASA